MSEPALAANAIPARNWGLMSLGIVCLAIGLMFAIEALNDFDVINDEHLKVWPISVVVEMSLAVVLMGFGPWCLLRGMRRNQSDRSV